MNRNTLFRNTVAAFNSVRAQLREHEIRMCMRQVTNVALTQTQRERAYARLVALVGCAA